MKATAHRPRAAAWLGVAVFLVAVNLRPAVASFGPLVTDIRDGLGLSDVGISVLTALPVVCFGALAPIGPWLTKRIGMARAVAVYCAAIGVGLLVRIGPDAATMFTGTLVAAGAIAALNVILPALIKRDFPRHTGVMMGLYTLALTGSAAIAAGLSVPLTHAIGHGWRGGLGIWAALAAVALLVWLPELRVAGADAVAAVTPRGLLRDRIAWMVTIYFGFQSLSFYAMLTWLPTLYQDHGLSESHAGALLSLSAAVQTPVALGLPALAIRLRTQTPLLVGSVLLTAGGLLALLVAPMASPYLWVVILGLGQGASFPLGLTLMVLRTRTPAVTQQLSSMSQGFGYLIAAVGPLLTGLLHSLTGHWTVPLAVLIALLAPQAIAGLAVARPGFAGD
ncbi:MAG TPA: MFS transporter [Acidothermaceae bacterium]|nr:MFS transporter [Acidothermaceae bacterium]